MLQISRCLAALAVAGVAIAVPAVSPAGATPDAPRISSCILLPQGCDGPDPVWEVPHLPEIPDHPEIEFPPCVLLPAGCLRPDNPRPDDPETPDEPETPETPDTTMPDSPAAPQPEPDTGVQVLSATAAVAVPASPNFTG